MVRILTALKHLTSPAIHGECGQALITLKTFWMCGQAWVLFLSFPTEMRGQLVVRDTYYLTVYLHVEEHQNYT